MKKFLLTGMCCLLTFSALHAQTEQKPADRVYSTYYYQRASHFETLPVTTKDIVFLGNSITDGAEWAELFENSRIKNRGISGDTTWGVYDRLDAILKGQPKKIFLLIGINDIGRGRNDQYVTDGIERIVKKIREVSPHTQLYVQSLLPVNPVYGKFDGHTSQWQRIPGINRTVQAIATRYDATYIDLFSHFVDAEGKMNANYSNDGLHLLGKGYQVWKQAVLPYIRK